MMDSDWSDWRGVVGAGEEGSENISCDYMEMEMEKRDLKQHACSLSRRSEHRERKIRTYTGKPAAKPRTLVSMLLAVVSFSFIYFYDSQTCIVRFPT